MRCNYCGELINQDEYYITDDLGGDMEVFHPDCFREAYCDTSDEDHRLDDPRHGQASEINRIR